MKSLTSQRLDELQAVQLLPKETPREDIEDYYKLIKLSPCEREILSLYGQGLSTIQVANAPGKKRSMKTVDAMVESIKRKSGLKSRYQLVVLAIRFGLAEVKPLKPLINGSPS